MKESPVTACSLVTTLTELSEFMKLEDILDQSCVTDDDLSCVREVERKTYFVLS